MHTRNPNSEPVATPIPQSAPVYGRFSPLANTSWIPTIPVQHILNFFRTLIPSPSSRAVIPALTPTNPAPTPSRTLPSNPLSQTPPRPTSPPALPRTRPRALTLPLPVPPLRPTYTNPQHSSIFITVLPLDVRYLIYDYVFHGRNNSDEDHGAKLIHIFFPRRKPGERRRPRSGLAHSCASDDVLGGPVVFLPGRCAHHGRSGFLAVALTCRIVYSEAIVRLYSTATFLFFQPRHLRNFATTILPQRLDSVCSLRIEWEKDYEWGARAALEWMEAWEIMARMKALKQLRISLRRREFESMDDRMKVAEPMMAMKGLSLFELLLPVAKEDDEDAWDFLIRAPFTVVDRFSKAGPREFK